MPLHQYATILLSNQNFTACIKKNNNAKKDFTERVKNLSRFQHILNNFSYLSRKQTNES